MSQVAFGTSLESSSSPAVSFGTSLLLTCFTTEKDTSQKHIPCDSSQPHRLIIRRAGRHAGSAKEVADRSGCPEKIMGPILGERLRQACPPSAYLSLFVLFLYAFHLCIPSYGL